MDSDEKYNFISKILYDAVLEGFYTKRSDIIKRNLKYDDFIVKNVHNEKFQDIKSFKAVLGNSNTNTCGFYALFYSMNYLKYLLNGKDLYYLYKNTTRKSFFKFHKKFLSFFIKEMPSLENYEIVELEKDGSLERHHLDFILSNNLLLKYLGKKYSELYSDYQKNKNYTFEFLWFDFIENNFSIPDNSKIKKLSEVFQNMSKFAKNNSPKIIFLFVGVIEHWILLIYDSTNESTILELDSYFGTQDILNLKYCDEKEIKDYVEKENLRVIEQRKKPLDKYAIMQFTNYIYDIHKLLFKMNNFILNNKDNISFEILIIEEKCNAFIESFNKLKIDYKEDNEINLLKIYEWLSKEYHPKRISEDYYLYMKEFNINKINCNNNKINEFFKVTQKIHDFLSKNIKIIEQNDIREILDRFLNVLNDINNL